MRNLSPRRSTSPRRFFTAGATVLFALFFAAPAGAASPNLTRDDLIGRLRIRADVFVLGHDGKHLEQIGDETRVFSGFSPEGRFKRDWSSSSTNYGSFKLRHEWTIDPRGAIHVKFEEFAEAALDSKTGEVKDFKNPIGSEERDVTDFGSILYPVKAIKGKRVVLRFIPELAPDTKTEKIGKFKIMGHGVAIYDSEGALWASDLDLGAEYSAITTYRGTLVLSYSAFRGAEPAGVASGKKITIRMKNYPRIVLQSETDFVPAGMNARVFVRYLKEKRTLALNSVRQSESSSERRMLERLK
jgi:hypothetical protein